MMRGEDKVGIDARKHLTACLAGGRFKPGRVMVIEDNTVNAERNPVHGTQLLTKISPQISVWREPMMHVYTSEMECVRGLVFKQDVQQYDRIDAAGQPQHQPLAGSDVTIQHGR